MSKGNALLALALAVTAVPIALSPRFWRATVRVETGPLADRVVLRAVVVAADGIAELAGPADGRVLGVLVHEGDSVKAGQLLAEVEGGAGASSRARITAPIAGTVLARRIDPGDSLSVASQGGARAIFEIADTARTAIRAELEERDAGRVYQGLAVRLTTPGARTVVGTGVIARVSARIERRTISADEARVRADGDVQAVSITWQGAPTHAPLGQRLEAEVALPMKRSATRVPRSAIVVRDGRTVVETPMLLWSREVPIQVGAADGALAEIRGVAPGTRVFLQ
jgi:multidrug efflux pump subunit AcrA (membrane-fusion protein)